MEDTRSIFIVFGGELTVTESLFNDNAMVDSSSEIIGLRIGTANITDSTFVSIHIIVNTHIYLFIKLIN